MAKKALLIGVSQYEAGLPSLAAAPKDVAAMQRVLQSSELGAFDDVKTLIDPDLEAMQTGIDLLFQSCQKGDLGLLYFSGHGITDDNDRLYLATRRTSKDTFRANSVPASFIQGIMDAHHHQRNYVLILDCCYSGAFAKDWRDMAKSADIKLKSQLEVEGSVVLTSSTSTQKSYEDKEGELSLYTNYIVQGIESGAAESDGDGFISADELHEYAKRHVQSAKPAMKPEIYGFRQGIKIIVSKARVDTKLEYRRLVERYAENGEISFVGQDILEIRREYWNISDEIAIAIENEVLEPDRKRLKNLECYEKSMKRAYKQQFPPTEKTLRDLKDLQELFGLTDENIRPIRDRVMAPYDKKKPGKLFTWNFIAITGGIVFLIILVLTFVNKNLFFLKVDPSPPSSTIKTINPTPKNEPSVTGNLTLNLDTSLPNPSILEMDGGTTMVALIRQLIDAYSQANPNLPITYGLNDKTPSSSDKGLKKLFDGTVAITATSRPLKPEEVKWGLELFRIGRDAIGIVVGVNNSFKGNLTLDQVRNIYQGKITNWSEVGGANFPIKVINRATDSGTLEVFQKIVLRGQPFATDGDNFITWKDDETTAILRELGDNGISYATVTQLKDQPTMRIIAIDGVSPTDIEARKSGKYPLTRNIFLAVRKTTSPAAAEFIKFALSPEGQKIVEDIGFLR